MKLIETHQDIEEWSPSTHRREPVVEPSPQDENYNFHPENPNLCWEIALGLGRAISRERMFA